MLHGETWLLLDFRNLGYQMPEKFYVLAGDELAMSCVQIELEKKFHLQYVTSRGFSILWKKLFVSKIFEFI